MVPSRSLLLVVDFQSRLMPAIHDGETAIRNANRLIEAAENRSRIRLSPAAQ
jgi:nicotinamidase-related amidase